MIASPQVWYYGATKALELAAIVGAVIAELEAFGDVVATGRRWSAARKTAERAGRVVEAVITGFRALGNGVAASSESQDSPGDTPPRHHRSGHRRRTRCRWHDAIAADLEAEAPGHALAEATVVGHPSSQTSVPSLTLLLQLWMRTQLTHSSLATVVDAVIADLGSLDDAVATRRGSGATQASNQEDPCRR